MAQNWRKIGARVPMTCKSKRAMIVLSKVVSWTKKTAYKADFRLCEAAFLLPKTEKGGLTW
jgi:hypothetical protein